MKIGNWKLPRYGFIVRQGDTQERLQLQGHAELHVPWW